MKSLAALCTLAACGGAQHARPAEGSLAGLARDHDSGAVIAHAEIRVRAQGQLQPLATTTASDGTYHVDHLPPGRYSIDASFAGQPVDIDHIDVRRGEQTIVDVTFTLGRPDPVHVDFGDPREGAIDRYRPAHHAPTTALIEGTINDTGSRVRVAGAVVTAIQDGRSDALQTVTDDQGRFRFDDVPPGTYQVSAYYSVDGHAQIEIRRSDIHVDAAEGVVVPLWVEITKP